MDNFRKMWTELELVNQKRSALQQIDEFRKLDAPPISGLDALLVAQVSMNQDIHAFMLF